jgi:putative peptide zinc metalloprotease protein
MQAKPAQPPPDEVILPPLRPDLLIAKQRYEGHTYYVIKDPVSLQYFRLTAEDYALATLFDGRRTFGEIREAFIAQNPHRLLEASEQEINERLAQFANDLALMQFLAVQGQRLKARFDSARRQKKKKGVLLRAINALFFGRKSLFDPDRLFGRMAKPVAWIWSPVCFWISMAMIAVAAFLFLQHTDRVASLMAHFFSLQNLALMWVATIVIKSIHELGHGLTCKHFGGEVHEVGVMFLVFTPFFFVNVTDSWVMPKRAHRVWVAFAGIYVELILASVATFLWVLTQPGLLQQFLYNVIVVASISTVVFNANPLMRFDGYYILTDLLEVPNLQTKSRALIGYQLKRLLFGAGTQDPVLSRMPLPKKRFWLFYIYAILSFLYGYYVIYSLSIHMAPHLAPYGLEGAANFMTGVALFAWVAMPLVGFVKGLQLGRDDWNPGGRFRRLSRIGLALAVLATAFLFYPRPFSIRRAGAIEIANLESIRPELPGIVEEILVEEGTVTRPGQPVARLRNRTVDEHLEAAKRRAAMAETMIQRSLAHERPSEFRQADTMRVQYRAAMEQAASDHGNLTLRTVSGGTVLTRDLHTLVGRLLKPGDTLCEIAPLDPIQIKVPLSQKQVRYVKKGSRAAIKANAYPHKVFEGRIATEPLLAVAHDIPSGLAKDRRGDVPTALDRQGREIPLDITYIATVEVPNPDGLLRPGMTGQGKIDAGRILNGRLVLQSILDWISLDFRF